MAGELGNIVGNAVNAALGNGKETQSTLQDFLTKFSDSSGKYANKLDPLNTFEVSFKFYPGEQGGDSKWYQRLGNSLLDSGKKAINNVADNLTGGLASAIGNMFNDTVSEAHDKYADVGKKSFMNYLLASNLLVGADNTLLGINGSSPTPLVWQLGYYVQAITIPQLKMPEATKSTTLVGEFPVNGTYIIPDNFQLVMEVLNTKLPLVDRVFYPWMREVTLPFWSYDSQPYTTADIMVDFGKHSDLRYTFYGCRPCNVQLLQPNQENDSNFKRNVTFMFDFMTIDSDLTTIESLKDKLLSTAGTLLNSGASMLNI